jgi:hypothetical protein
MTSINYNNGKIYKIEPICEYEDGDIYIGSTTKQYLSQRMTAHRAKYNQYKNNKCNKTKSFDLFDKYGIDNCQIVLLELVNVESKNELYQREAYYIRTLKCVNKYIPLRTGKEYRETNKEKIKEYDKEYREANKEKIKKYDKEYKVANKEKIKEYEEANKEKIKDQKKIWREANKEKIKEYSKQYYKKKIEGGKI